MTSTQTPAPQADYLRAIWTILIAFGGAIAPERFTGERRPRIGRYDGALEIDRELTNRIALMFVAGGSGIVDFASCTDPAEGSGWHGDTEDFDQEARYIAGELALANGDRIPWGALLPEGAFGRLVRLLTSPEATDLDAAFGHLLRRLREAEWSFRYTCEIGRHADD